MKLSSSFWCDSGQIKARFASPRWREDGADSMGWWRHLNRAQSAAVAELSLRRTGRERKGLRQLLGKMQFAPCYFLVLADRNLALELLILFPNRKSALELFPIFWKSPSSPVTLIPRTCSSLFASFLHRISSLFDFFSNSAKTCNQSMQIHSKLNIHAFE